MSQRDIEIIDLYLNHPELTTMEIAERYGISVGTIARIIRINNVPKRVPCSGIRYSTEQIHDILEQYQKGASLYSLQKKYKISYERLKRLLQINGIEQMSYSKHLNPDLIEDYFEIIDNPNKAYWLGFLISDGTIACNPEKGKFQISLTLHPEDSYILHLLEQDLHVSHKVYDTITGYKRFDLGSKKMVNDLINLNITPNKTFTVQIPYNLIPQQYYPDLIRGIFDGDGCFSITRRASGQINRELSFCGNQYVITWIRDTLCSTIEGLTYKKVLDEASIKRVRWGAKKDIKLIYHYMYYDNTDIHYLTRKKENIQANTEVSE